MARSVANIQEEIRNLSASEKEEILSALIDDLDGPTDDGAEAAWLAEITRRGQEIDQGAVQCVPAAEVFARLDTLLRK